VLAQEPYPTGGTKVQEWKNIVGETVTDGDRAGELYFLPKGVREMLQHSAKELVMGLPNGVADADIVWPASERGEAMEASQFSAHRLLGSVGEGLACVVKGEEAVPAGGCTATPAVRSCWRRALASGNTVACWAIAAQ
jgi:hypothetical protein